MHPKQAIKQALNFRFIKQHRTDAQNKIHLPKVITIYLSSPPRRALLHRSPFNLDPSDINATHREEKKALNRRSLKTLFLGTHVLHTRTLCDWEFAHDFKHFQTFELMNVEILEKIEIFEFILGNNFSNLLLGSTYNRGKICFAHFLGARDIIIIAIS